MYKSIGSKIVKIDDKNPIINESSAESRTIVNQYRLCDHMAEMCSEISKIVSVRTQINSISGEDAGKQIFDVMGDALNSIISNQIYIEGMLDITKNVSIGFNKFVKDNLADINLYSRYIKKEGLDVVQYDADRIFPMSYLPDYFRLNPNFRSLSFETLKNLNKMKSNTDLVASSFNHRELSEIANSRGYEDVKDLFIALSDSNTWSKYTTTRRYDVSIVDSYFVQEHLEIEAINSTSKNETPLTPLEVLSNCINILRYLETLYMASSMDQDEPDEITRQDIYKMVGILADVIFNVSTISVMKDISCLNNAMEEAAKKNAVVSRIEFIKVKISEIK
jgi:hypothetical protein